MAAAEAERHATWMELFYDLVFVVAVAELAHKLKDHLSTATILEVVLLFVPVWWSWVGVTFWADRFDRDTLPQRVLLALQMLAAAALAVNVHDGVGAGSRAFAISYVAGRLLLVFQYLLVGRKHAAAAPLARRYASGFSIAAAVWLASLAVPPPLRFWMWAAGFAIDFATPLTARALQARLPLDVSHLPERFALFTLIVLGESVVAVCQGVSSMHWSAASTATAAIAFGLAFGLWWMYFERIEGSAVRKVFFAGQVWVYTHLPLALGLAATGAAVQRVVMRVDAGALEAGDRWLLAGAVGLCLASIGVIHSTMTGRERSARLRLGGAVIALALAWLPVHGAILVGILAILAISLGALGRSLDRSDPRPHAEQVP
jgi:low temperature requirement protein LtrA